MKLVTGVNLLSTRNVEKDISKKILLANTSDKIVNNERVMKKAIGSPAEPIYFQNSSSVAFNPDIRYQNNWGFSPLNSVNFRNDLLIFAENNEIKKAVQIITNEIIVSQLKDRKYPVFPTLNLTLLPEDKQKVGEVIQKYIDEVFYPKLYQMLNFKKDGLKNIIKEYLITGKLAYEIIYDNLKNPKDIIGIIPIDPATLQKVKRNNYVYFVQRPLIDAGRERILHENQVILIEWNEYDFGYISYVDKLRRAFNIMRSMQSSKVLWFAAKSQVRMHIKLALGDLSREQALQKLSTMKNNYTNSFSFDDNSGTLSFNGKPNSSGYREFFTAETAQSGSPEIEEINTNGPDLTETDSLNYWEKLYWKETEIPYDRIDPNASDSWGFTDVSNLRKIEINFSKFIEGIRETINDIFMKPIIIQLTLKEIEIGIDLSLLDAIIMEWIAFNEYDKLGELEIMNKKIEIASNLSAFGVMEDAAGSSRNFMPISWIVDNFLDFSAEQKSAIEVSRKKENIMLGFPIEGGTINIEEEIVDDSGDEEFIDEEGTEEENITDFEDNQWI